MLEQFGYKIRGKLDIEKLKNSFTEIVQKHGVLRTVFRNDLTEDTLQIVRKKVEPDFRVIDISEKTKEEQEVFIAEFRLEDRQEGFDLLHGSLVRVIILRLSEDEHYKIWSSHHLNLDGWSANAVLAEFDRLYESKVKGENGYIK